MNIPRKNARKNRTCEFAGYTLHIDSSKVVQRKLVDTKPRGDYGADPIGDGTFRMVPSGDIVSYQERCRRLSGR